jgi:tripartite-type tricarboxylate transporter receptor subunit TctC
MEFMKTRSMISMIMLLAALMMTGFFSLAAAAEEEKFPVKAISCIVGSGAGGGMDLTGRAVSSNVEKFLGKPMIIVNKPGAGQEIGMSELQRSKPDGYTIGVVATPTLVLNTLERATSYNLTDYTYLIGLVEDPRTIAVAANSKWKTIQDVMAYAKANPGKFRIGHGGVGTSSQYAILDFGDKAKIDITDVPFVGSATSIAAVLGGHMEAACPAVGEVIKNVEAGQMRILVVFGDKRSAGAPNIPTAREVGLDSVHIALRGLAGPKGIPANRASILHDAFKKAMETPEYVKLMKGMAIDSRYMTGEEFRKQVEDCVVAYKPLVLKIKGAIAAPKK